MNTYVPSAGTKLYRGAEVTGTFGTSALRAAAMAAAASGLIGDGNVRKWGKMPASPRSEIDITPANATDDDGNDDMHERSAPGWSKPGTMEFTVALDDATIAQLEADKEGGLYYTWRLAYKSGASRVATGWIMDVAHEIGDKGEVVATITVQMVGRMYYVGATAFSILQTAVVTASKEVTLIYNGTVNAADFVLGNLGLIHSGTLTPAGTVTAGADANQIKISAAGFQANPAGDTYFVQGPSYVVPRPATGIVRAP